MKFEHLPMKLRGITKRKAEMMKVKVKEGFYDSLSPLYSLKELHYLLSKLRAKNKIPIINKIQN